MKEWMNESDTNVSNELLFAVYFYSDFFDYLLFLPGCGKHMTAVGTHSIDWTFMAFDFSNRREIFHIPDF